MLDIVQSVLSVCCKSLIIWSVRDISCCSAEGLESDVGSSTACKYSESERFT